MGSKTAIEALIDRANAEDGSPGYHVTARFADGSVVDAPYVKVGPNWVLVAELEDEPTMITTGDATELEVNWSPGQAYAEGPRFEHLNAPQGRETPGMGR